jgi:WD40 repeat protein
MSVAFYPDGRWVASGSNDCTLRVWPRNTGQLIDPPLEGHTIGVKSVAYSPDGSQLISGSWDKTTRIWSKTRSKEWPVLGQITTLTHL